MTKFEIVDSLSYVDDSTTYLVNNNWDDWFEFETQLPEDYFSLGVNDYYYSSLKGGR